MKMSALTKKERTILLAFAETLIPAKGDELERAAEMTKFADRLDNHATYFSKDVRISFRFLLLFFNYSAFFYRLKLRTFCRMNKELRLRYLEAWHNSWLAAKRAMWRFLDAVVYMNYYASPSVSAKIGYTPKFKTIVHKPDYPTDNLFLRPFEGGKKENCDVCVIGSGAGGAVIAKTLAEHGKKVVMI